MSARRVRATTTPGPAQNRLVVGTLLAVTIALLIGCSGGSKSVLNPRRQRTADRGVFDDDYSLLDAPLGPLADPARRRRSTDHR